MTTRSQPFRNKIPINILQIISVATRITLYLVGQNGPTSFVFKDRLNNKFKVSIGDTIRCSCQPNKNDHCIHSMYVMIRIFKLDPENPLIWQASYLDSELTDIISGKYSVNNIKPRHLTMLEFSDLETNYKFKSKPLEVIHSEKMKLQEDSVCPICQQQMKQDMLITYCKVKCGNNFHLHCLKIWVEHKISTQATISCPMCRCEFSNQILENLNEEQKQFKKKEQKIKYAKESLKFSCKSCGLDEIPNHIYKCLFCSDYTMCIGCFNSNKHIKHPFILCIDGEWRGSAERRENEKKINDFINKKRKQNYTEQIINKIASVNLEPCKLYDFLASAYPYVSKYISENIDPYKKMDFQPEDLKCMSCGSTKMIFLRRIPCGHFIDHNCLKEYITVGKFFCNIDGNKFLKGYETLMKLKQEMLHQQNLIIDTPKIESKQDEIYHIFQQQNNEETLAQILGMRQLKRKPPLNPERINRNRFTHNIINEEQSMNIRVRNVSNRNNFNSQSRQRQNTNNNLQVFQIPRIERSIQSVIKKRLGQN